MTCRTASIVRRSRYRRPTSAPTKADAPPPTSRPTSIAAPCCGEHPRIDAQSRDVDQTGDGHAGRDERVTIEPGPGQERRPQRSLHARDATGQPAQHPAERHIRRRERQPLPARHPLHEHEHQQQRADQQLAVRHVKDTAAERPRDQRRLAGQAHEPPGAEQRRHQRGQAESPDRRPMRTPSDQSELEEAVEEVHDACRRHGSLDRHEDGKYRHQQRAEPEARNEGQRRRRERDQPRRPASSSRANHSTGSRQQWRHNGRTPAAASAVAHRVRDRHGPGVSPWTHNVSSGRPAAPRARANEAGPTHSMARVQAASASCSTAPGTSRGVNVPSSSYARSRKPSATTRSRAAAPAAASADPCGAYNAREASTCDDAGDNGSGHRRSCEARLYRAPCGFTWRTSRPPRRMAHKARTWRATVSVTAAAVSGMTRRPNPSRSGYDGWAPICTPSAAAASATAAHARVVAGVGAAGDVGDVTRRSSAQRRGRRRAIVLAEIGVQIEAGTHPSSMRAGRRTGTNGQRPRRLRSPCCRRSGSPALWHRATNRPPTRQ